MKIGIDLDNTIIDYTDDFPEVIREGAGKFPV